MELIGDDHLERAVTELGEPEALYRIGRGRFLAKLALGVLLLVYGAVGNYIWWGRGPATFDHFVFLFLVVPPLSGASLLVHMYRHRGLYVLVYPVGLLRLQRGEVDSFPWQEIETVRIRVQRADAALFSRDKDGNTIACWLPADVPTFKLWDAGFTLVRSDGAEAHFGPALSDFDLLAEEVQRRSFAWLWPAVRRRFLAGACVPFGELELEPAGLWHGGKLLPWRELKELTIAQGKLSLKQSGKWLPWALIDMAGVPNPHLLFALVEEARRAGFPLPREPHEHRSEQPSRNAERGTRNAE
jgi:hypothetical protein